MRIVGGALSGRVLEAPAGDQTRPTSDRVREALFNILAHNDWGNIESALVCDAFAGSGALGLEALSRGAKHAWLLENAPPAFRTLKMNVEQLDLTARCECLYEDAIDPPPAEQACNLIFLDPPYRKNLVPLALAALQKTGWIAKGAIIVAETAKKETVAVDGYEMLLSRAYGDTALHFLKA